MTIDQAFNLALQKHQSGNLAEAEVIYRQILAQLPNHADTLHALGVLAHQANRNDLSLDMITRAIAADPSKAQYYCNLSVVLTASGRCEEAVAACRHAISLEPSALFFCNLANALWQSDQHPQAIEAARQAIALDPKMAGAYANLGNALGSLGKHHEAIEAFHQSIALRPDSADSHNSLGKALYAIGEIDNAIASLRHAISLRHDYPEAHSNLGNAWCEKLQWAQAIESCRAALALRPDYPAAHWNLALMLLRQGDFAQGWLEYEWRWRVKGLRQKLDIPRPYWDGTELDGRRILIHCEQGFGDTLQFLRFISEVAKRGGRIILATQPELLTLLKDFPGVEELVSSKLPLPDFDLHCPIMSLPRVFKLTPDTIPAPIPYLRSDLEKSARWKNRLAADRKTKIGAKIGLVWAGRPEYSHDSTRSFPLAAYHSLSQVTNVGFYSLQKGEAAAQARTYSFPLTDWTADLNDFSDTAAFISNLDLIITADTAVAHLAGALGKPAWVVLPAVPDWRWMLDRNDSPWYPTLRLFRQTQRGVWQTPIGHISQELRSP